MAAGATFIVMDGPLPPQPDPVKLDGDQWWIPEMHGCDFYERGIVPSQGNHPGVGRYIGVRCEERDGVPGFVVRPDPDHPTWPGPEDYAVPG